MQNIMKNKRNIRNICIVSHVDHGKTTLSDHLLQAGGLLSKTMVGTARALDYLEEEQKRGITIKTANISFTYNYCNEEYLINLVDSPGHVDFSGNVSQALRLVDGVIIVVDSVEGVMAQTESVIKQAMREGLKPILFINKIDRLINELKLKEREIERRLSNIIQMVNELVNQYVYDAYKQKWEISFKTGGVLIGSALEGWAISNYQKNIPKFSEIIGLYKKNMQNKLKEEYKIINTMMPAIIEKIPNPIEAQTMRVNYITEYIDEKNLEKIKECDGDNEIILCIGKMLYEKHKGIITVARVFSGTINTGKELLNKRTNKIVKVLQVAVYKGEKLITTNEIDAGNIVALIGLKDVIIGDTLIEKNTQDKQIKFKQISYLQEPVIERRIEPLKIAKIPKLQEKLEVFALIKPNFQYSIEGDTGQIKIYGIGELQLEIIIDEIRKEGIELEVSEPEVALVEQINENVQLEFVDSLELMKIELECRRTPQKVEEYNYKDKRNNILIYDNEKYDSRIKEMILIAFKNAVFRGVESEYPIRNLTVKIKNILQLKENSLRYEIVVPTIKKAVHKGLVKGGSCVHEPIYEYTITTPTHYLGKILNITEKYRCKVENIHHLGSRSVIEGEITVKKSLDVANDLRSASDGYAFWQFSFKGYQKKE